MKSFKMEDNKYLKAASTATKRVFCTFLQVNSFSGKSEKKQFEI